MPRAKALVLSLKSEATGSLVTVCGWVVERQAV